MNPMLSTDEIITFHDRGFLGPFPALDPAAMRPVAEDIIGRIFMTPGPDPRNMRQGRHLDSPEVYSLVSHPAIVSRLLGLLGEDIQCWSCGAFHKEPLVGRATPWHQDINYWPLSPAVNVTCWLALTDINHDNSPLQVVRGSHLRQHAHRQVQDADLGEEVDPSAFAPRDVVTLTMPMGSFVLFNERIIHGAPPNRSPLSRTGLVIRYTMGVTKVFHGQGNIGYDRHRVLFVAGRDRLGINRVGSPPIPLASIGW